MAKKKLAELKKYEVRWSKQNSCWFINFPNKVRSRYQLKRLAVRDAAIYACNNQPSSLLIRNQWGEFQEERTYPRSRDPRRSKG